MAKEMWKDWAVSLEYSVMADNTSSKQTAHVDNMRCSHPESAHVCTRDFYHLFARLIRFGMRLSMICLEVAIPRQLLALAR